MAQSVNVLGGVTRAKRIAGLNTTGREVVMASGDNARLITKWVRIQNVGGNALRLFFCAEDFAADANYHTLAASTGVVEGPFEFRTSAADNKASLWMKSAAATTDVEILMVHQH